MSLSEMMSQHTVDIERNASTSGSTMGTARSYSTGNRPSGAPTTGADCRVVPTSANERNKYSQMGMTVSHTVYFETDPQSDDRDRLVFDTTRYLYVRGARTPDEMGLASNPRLSHYMLMCQEVPGGEK